MYKFLIALLCSQILFLSMVYASGDSLQYEHFSIENGLPSNHVYSVIQDRAGYVWFLTDNGIVKYNGYTFKLFNTSNGLPSNDVWQLTEDRYGRLWVHTYAYEVGYIKDNRYYKLNYKVEGSVRINDVFEQNSYIYLVLSNGVILVVDNKGMCNVVSTDHTGISIGKHYATGRTIKGYKLLTAKYIWRNSRIERANLCYEEHVGYNSYTVFDGKAILTNPNNLIITVLDISDCRVSLRNLIDDGATSAEKLYLVYINKHNLHVVTNKQIYVYDEQFKLVKRINYSIEPFSIGQLTYYYKGTNNQNWYSSLSSGCFLKYNIKSSFIFNQPLSAFPTSKKIGTTLNGHSFWFDEITFKLTEIDEYGDIVFSKQVDENIKNITTGRNGKNYYLTREDILQSTNGWDEAEKLIGIKNHIFVQSLYEGDYKYYLKKRNDTIQELKEGARIDALGFYTKIREYTPDSFYAIGSNGLRLITQKNNDVYVKTVTITKFKELEYDSIRNLYWMYDANNVMVLNPVNGKYILISPEALHKLQISNIVRIFSDQFHNIYVQTDNQLFVFNTRQWKYCNIDLGVNLHDSKILIKNNKITIAGKFGLAQTEIRGPLLFEKSSIVPNINAYYFNRVNDLSVSDSRIIISTDKGFYTLDPVVFAEKGYTTYGDEMLALVYPYQKRIDNMDTLKIPSGTNAITLDCINFLGKGQPVFEYEIDKTLIKAKQSYSGEVFLENLVADKVCKVTCTVMDDFWRSKKHVFYIYKVPYWYQTSTMVHLFWVAGVLAFIVIILSVVLVTKWVVARSNERKRKLMELELRAIYSQINPHFIFNSLSSAMYFINKKSYEDAYNNVSKFSKLLRSYIKSSRERYVILSEEIEMLKNYIELQKVRFEETFEYSFTVDKRIPADNLQIPSLLLQPLVENAINHGLFHKGKGGLLEVIFEQGADSTELICYIKDNGVGRQRSQEIKEESSVKHHSYGTTLTQELMDLFKKYEQMDIELEYTDRQPPETGTTVKLVIRNVKYTV